MNYADEHQHHRDPAAARLFARAEALFALYLTAPPAAPSAGASAASSAGASAGPSDTAAEERARWTSEVVRALYGRQDASR